MHSLTGKAVDAFDLGPFGNVELSNCTDKEVAGDRVTFLVLCFFGAACLSDFRVPLLGLIVPSGLGDIAIEAHMLIQIVLLGYVDEIG